MKFYVLLSSIALVACSSLPQKSSHSLGAVTEVECSAAGGRWLGVPGAEYALCPLPVTDGGKSCTDSSQCQLRCIAGEDVQVGAKVKGICQGRHNHWGCHQFVENGRAGHELCVDPPEA